MTADDATDVLTEEPALRHSVSARAIDELVQQERTRQDARLSALRRLRGDAAALLDVDKDPAGLGARVLGALKRRRAPSEEEVRARYEEAQVRARRAALFAEALGSLEGELHEEVSRMRRLLVELAEDEQVLDALLLRVRAVAGDAVAALGAASGAGRGHAKELELEARVEAAKVRADALDGKRERLRAAEDRLLGLLESERMLAERLGVLRREVESAARAAARTLDDMADQLRALATSTDTRRVVRALEGSLAALLGSLSESARAVEDTLAGTSTASDDEARDR